MKIISKINSSPVVQLECEFCKTIFHKDKKRVQSALKNNDYRCKFCSKKCFNQSKIKKILINCTLCAIQFLILPNQLARSKNHFCSRSCSTKYNNTHKTTGTRRSKLEVWLEEKLTSLYPNLEMQFNKKDAINSELDIYIPSLNLAFELNGIFHYEPIYGSDKLSSIQNNDGRKFQACLEQKIELVIIDSSGMKNFKEKNAIKYLNIINLIISAKL